MRDSWMGRIEKTAAAALAVAIMAALAACGAGDQPQPPPDCLPVPQALREKIESGLTVRGGGSIAAAAAVRSPDHERWYYIAADIDGPGLEGPGHVGVWASNRVDGSGLLFSVGEVATGFSDWGDGANTVARLRHSDPGAYAARQCL